MVKIGADDSGLQEGIKKAGTVVKGFAKAGAVALTATTTAVAALTGKALDAYANFEQLTGGVETLFKDSAPIVQQYAEQAFKTAGLSANDYMETVTSFSASLLQSVGNDTAAAAQKADMAITDMSDNANKMGTSMESIQNAYQGFAKQNYTMLDNLKLGYGGTKEEMQRLLSDAQKISGIKYDVSSYSDIVDAIHVVQTEMGITGTTAQEAATTISGSLNSMKSAWENWVTALGRDDADLGEYTGRLVNSAFTFVQNALPRIGEILSSITTAVTTQLPALLSPVLDLIMENLPQFIGAGAELLVALITGLLNALPQLISQIPIILKMVVSAFQNAAPQLLAAGKNLLEFLVNGLVTGIPKLIAALPEVIITIMNFITSNLPAILSAGVDILLALAKGIIATIPTLVASIPKVIVAIVNALIAALSSVVSAGAKIIDAIVEGISSVWEKLVEKAKEIIDKIVEALGNALDKVVEVGKKVVQSIIDGISSAWNGLVSWFNGIWDSLFGSRTVNVNVNKRGGETTRAGGLDYVPYDGYPAILHRGEAVLTQREAAAWKSGGNGGNIINIYPQTLDEATIDYLYNRFNAQMGATT